MKTQTKMRGMVLLAGGVIALSGLTATSAQATSREQYDNAAIGLGVAGIILGSQGKTLPAVIAGAGAYYAYSKGQETRDDYWRHHRRDGYNNNYGYNNRYDNSYGYAYNSGSYNGGGYNGGGYNGYPHDNNNGYNRNNSYNNGYNYNRSNNSYSNTYNKGYNSNRYNSGNIYPETSGSDRSRHHDGNDSLD